MIRVIIPLGEAGKKTENWVKQVGIYSVSLVGVSTGFGYAIGYLGDVTRNYWGGSNFYFVTLVSITLLGIITSTYDLGIIPFRLPQLHWQVPAHWLRLGAVKSSLLYGTILGSGFLTYIHYGTFYMLVAFEFLVGSLRGGILGFVFGISRILPLIVTAIGANKFDWDIEKGMLKLMTEKTQFHFANGVFSSIIVQVFIVVLAF